MSCYKQSYKMNPRLGFGNADHDRFICAYKREETRRRVRRRTFDRNRNLQDVSAFASPQYGENISNIKNDHMNRLKKWKEERNKMKKSKDTKKKPIFKVGVVRHALYSPAAMNDTVTFKRVKSSNIKKWITRTTEKRLLAKAAADIINQLAVASKHAVPTSSAKDLINVKKPDIKKQKSFAPANHIFKPPSGLLKLPSLGFIPIEETPKRGDFLLQAKLIHDIKTPNVNNQKDILSQKLDTQKKNSNEKESHDEDLIVFSPYLTVSGDKNNAEKEPDNEDSSLQYANLNKGCVICTPLSSRKSIGFRENIDTQHNARRSNELCKSTPTRRITSFKTYQDVSSLVQQEYFSDTPESMRNSFAAVKISQIYKTPEIQLDDAILYINSDQTSNKDEELKKSEEIVNKDHLGSAQIKWGSALDGIDSFDLDNLTPEVCINSEKRLHFETEDSDSSSDNSELICMRLKKEQDKSRLSIRNTSDSNARMSRNDMTSTITFRKSSLSDNSKIRSRGRKRSSKYQVERSNMMESLIINIIPSTPLINIKTTPVISETMSNLIDTERGRESEIRIHRNRIAIMPDTLRKSR